MERFPLISTLNLNHTHPALWRTYISFYSLLKAIHLHHRMIVKSLLYGSLQWNGYRVNQSEAPSVLSIGSLQASIPLQFCLPPGMESPGKNGGWLAIQSGWQPGNTRRSLLSCLHYEPNEWLNSHFCPVLLFCCYSENRENGFLGGVQHTSNGTRLFVSWLLSRLSRDAGAAVATVGTVNWMESSWSQ